MLHHVVTFRWRQGTTAAAVDALATALAELPQQIPELRDYRFGRDVGLAPTTADFAVVAGFDDVVGFVAYRDHPEHRRVVVELVEPIVAERSAVQFEQR